MMPGYRKLEKTVFIEHDRLLIWQTLYLERRRTAAAREPLGKLGKTRQKTQLAGPV